MSLMDQLTNVVASQITQQAAQKTGLSQDMTAKLMPMAMAALMGGLKKNTANPDGARALSNALERHDGSMLGDVSAAVGRDDVLADGQKILGHILGGKRAQAEQTLAAAAGGADSNQIGNLLAMAAPLVMNQLGQAKRTQSLDDAGLAGLIREEGMRAREKAPSELGGLMSMLDADGDGDIKDDLLGAAVKGGLGKSILGGLFGRK